MSNVFNTRRSLIMAGLMICAFAAATGSWLRTTAYAQDDNLTPGMIFGPVNSGEGQRIELCASNLGEGEIVALVHFRNMDSGEVTANETLTLPSGGGACAHYSGQGHVVGMARGEGRASDWVSPSNALISTMSVIDINGGVRVSVLGNAKLWLRGL